MKQHLSLPQLPKQDQSGNINQQELIHFLSAIQRILSDKQREDFGEFEKIEKRVIDLLYPVGSRYIQFPEPDGTWNSAEAPGNKFGGLWVLKFATEGVFFRTEGGRSAESRGGTGIQGDIFKSHSHLPGVNPQFITNTYPGTGEWATPAKTPGHINMNGGGVTASTGGTETRSINRIIRIYERTA